MISHSVPALWCSSVMEASELVFTQRWRKTSLGRVMPPSWRYILVPRTKLPRPAKTVHKNEFEHYAIPFVGFMTNAKFETFYLFYG